MKYISLENTSTCCPHILGSLVDYICQSSFLLIVAIWLIYLQYNGNITSISMCIIPHTFTFSLLVQWALEWNGSRLGTLEDTR